MQLHRWEEKNDDEGWGLVTSGNRRKILPVSSVQQSAGASRA